MASAVCLNYTDNFPKKKKKEFSVAKLCLINKETTCEQIQAIEVALSKFLPGFPLLFHGTSFFRWLFEIVFLFSEDLFINNNKANQILEFLSKVDPLSFFSLFSLAKRKKRKKERIKQKIRLREM